MMYNYTIIKEKTNLIVLKKDELLALSTKRLLNIFKQKHTWKGYPYDSGCWSCNNGDCGCSESNNKDKRVAQAINLSVDNYFLFIKEILSSREHIPNKKRNKNFNRNNVLQNRYIKRYRLYTKTREELLAFHSDNCNSSFYIRRRYPFHSFKDLVLKCELIRKSKEVSPK